MQEALEQGLEKHSIPFHWVEVKKFSWTDRLQWHLSESRSRPEELIIFCDAWDVMLNSGEKLKALEASGFFDGRIVLSGDSACWPAQDAKDFFEDNGPWSYICAGVMAGKGADIAAAIEHGLANKFDADIEDGTDQLFWYREKLFGKSRIDIDHDTRFVMSLSATPRSAFAIKNGKATNVANGEIPAFIHFNGASRKYLLLEILEILEGQ